MSDSYVRSTTPFPSGVGNVTSVALAAPASILSVSGSPVTTSGTLTLALATQSANKVWSGPTTGAAATPTFRSLVAADLPTALLEGNGSLSAPSYSFSSETNSGWYKSAAGVLSLSLLGTLQMSLTKNGFSGLTLDMPNDLSGISLGAASTHPSLVGDTSFNVISSAYNVTACLYGFGNANYPIYRIRHAGGSLASPTALPSGSLLGSLAFNGYNGSSYPYTTGAAIFATATENYTSTNGGTKLTIQTTPQGSGGVIRDAVVVGQDASVTLSNGNLAISLAGKGLQVKEGSNAKMGTAVLVAGTVTVANTSVTANSRIFLTSQADGGTPGFLRVSARTASTSFDITSSSNSDTSTVAYMIVEPA